MEKLSQIINDTNIYMGIDTIQVRSQSDSDCVVSYASKICRGNKQDKAYYYKFNPDGASKSIGAGAIYTYSDYQNIVKYILNEHKIYDAVKVRIDYRFDSYVDNYLVLQKLNKMLIMLVALEVGARNLYYSENPLTLSSLCSRLEKNSLQMENYNKAIQEPNGDVKNRLELRSKQLGRDAKITESDKEYKYYMRWLERLNKAVTKDNYHKLTYALNDTLERIYNASQCDRSLTTTEFLFHYKNSIFSRSQLIDIYTRLGSKNPKGAADKYRQRKGIDYVTYNDLKIYLNKLRESGEIFFNS